MKLLIVEDEILMHNIIAKGLKKTGYAVDSAYDGEEALELFDVNSYDLIVLDLNLPKVDGMEVLHQIRQKDHEVKVLILSARSRVEDRIQGLDAGSNDYLVKPFDFQELEARIRCLLRRNFIQEDTVQRYHNITLDTAKKMIFVDDKKCDLTKKEYGILEYLLLHKNRVIQTEELIEHVWDSETDLFSNSFKFHMSSLKKKLAANDANIMIKNLRGQGYLIEDEEVL
ncbi:response regulator transcription factor [Anaerosporobacter faecicola]|uniref:response regulator transcription factor n=1 Tax=Anaerosporobacter faecicola TaxID=2718714 RepID=UPI00143BD7C6|nr:response regulator transcription factor [Anaerosporobacter faecicola]